jgi:hypothetical protein
MDENSMYNTLTQLGFKNPFGDNKLYPFYCLVEVASNREGPENAERLYELLGASEDLIIVRIHMYVTSFRTGWLHKMRAKRRRYGKSERKSHLLISRRDM